MSSQIRIVGARQNNLKSLDLTIATGELVVVTGVSGSGKSSLAFDTLYACLLYTSGRLTPRPENQRSYR